jgi:uncharacterized protein
MSDAPDLPAGDFGPWAVAMQAAIRGDGESDVPCAGCTACCRSAQFVHVAPDEADARAHIPAELLVAAPGLPDGNHVLGYDERGHCPLLVDGGCSIYAHRPRACRTYDCRVFAAAGVGLDAGAVAERARRWRFGLASEKDRRRHAAVRAAAEFLDGLPEAERPRNDTEHAVLAVELHDTFLA